MWLVVYVDAAIITSASIHICCRTEMHFWEFTLSVCYFSHISLPMVNVYLLNMSVCDTVISNSLLTRLKRNKCLHVSSCECVVCMPGSANISALCLCVSNC